MAIPVGANILWSWFRTQPVLAALESLDTEFLYTDIINKSYLRFWTRSSWTQT